MFSWETMKGRAWVYVDDTGKIVGEVEHSLTRGDYLATANGTVLGRYVDLVNAQNAVERAVNAASAPTLLAASSKVLA